MGLLTLLTRLHTTTRRSTTTRPFKPVAKLQLGFAASAAVWASLPDSRWMPEAGSMWSSIALDAVCDEEEDGMGVPTMPDAAPPIAPRSDVRKPAKRPSCVPRLDLSCLRIDDPVEKGPMTGNLSASDESESEWSELSDGESEVEAQVAGGGEAEEGLGRAGSWGSGGSNSNSGSRRNSRAGAGYQELPKPTLAQLHCKELAINASYANKVIRDLSAELAANRLEVEEAQAKVYELCQYAKGLQSENNLLKAHIYMYSRAATQAQQQAPAQGEEWEGEGSGSGGERGCEESGGGASDECEQGEEGLLSAERSEDMASGGDGSESESESEGLLSEEEGSECCSSGSSGSSGGSTTSRSRTSDGSSGGESCSGSDDDGGDDDGCSSDGSGSGSDGA